MPGKPILLAVICTVLAVSAAHAVKPPDEEKREPDAKVSFPAFDGSVMLDAYVWLPAGAGPFPAIVAQHGCGGVFNDPGDPSFDNIAGKLRYWGKQLSEAGFLFLLVDSFTPRGFGDEPTDGEVCDTPWQDRPVEIDAVLSRPFDAYAGLDYARSRGDVAAGRVGLIGWSNGGSSSLSAIAWSAEAPLLAPGVDFFSDPADFELMRLEGFFASVSIYPGCGQHGHYPDGTYRSYTRGRVFAGDADSVSDDCPSLVAEAQVNGSEITLHWYPGEDHGYDYDEWDGAAAQDTRTRVIEHFQEHVDDGIFESGFEVGDTRHWSAVVP